MGNRHMKLNQDCRYFSPDGPCAFHKEEGAVCAECRHYRRFSGRILIIKLAAIGDVLRTTSVLAPLTRRYPDAKIVWFTERQCRPVLEGNPFIDEIWTEGFGSLQALSLFRFDLLINADLSFDALTLAGNIRAREKRGFWYDAHGIVQCSSPAARAWFLLSHDDALKRKNRSTYQHFLARVSGVPSCGDIVVPVSGGARKAASRFAARHGLTGRRILGVNVGSGSRWITKRWPEEYFLALFPLVRDRFSIVIFGGSGEKDILARLAKKSRVPVVNAGHGNSIGDFFALLDLCDVVLTGDTLALHAALGLKKKVVALFGPTSAAEIDMYGRGEKLSGRVSCICCYRRTCPEHLACMRALTPDRVARAILRYADET